MRVWEEIDSGRMKWGDAERGGQCHEPIEGCRFFGVLHKELRSFDFIEKIYYRLIAGIYDWGDGKTNPNKPYITAAKNEAIQHCRDSFGFLMYTPSSSGGNTDCGGIAKRFLDPNNRAKICSVIRKDEDRENFAELLHYFNLLLTVTQSTVRRQGHWYPAHATHKDWFHRQLWKGLGAGD